MKNHENSVWTFPIEPRLFSDVADSILMLLDVVCSGLVRIPHTLHSLRLSYEVPNMEHFPESENFKIFKIAGISKNPRFSILKKMLNREDDSCLRLHTV